MADPKIKDDQVRNESNEFENIVEFLKDTLFAGTSSSNVGVSDYQQQCERTGGKVPGATPACITGDSELIAQIQAKCVHDASFKCIQTLKFADDKNCDEQMTWKANHNASVPEYAHDQNFKGDKVTFLDEFQDCLSKIDCQCKKCFIRENFPPPDSGDDTPDEPTTPDTPPDDGQQQDPDITIIKTASQYTSIPVVFGEYVVGGNIIWIGEPFYTPYTYFTVSDTGVKQGPFTEQHGTDNFMIGCAAGVVDSLLRVWFGDVLVYNQTLSNDAATDIDLSLLSDGTYSLNRLAATQPKLKFFKGTSSQKVNKDYAAAQGFGKVPAHRDLSYVYFTNVDMTLFGNSFPAITMDIVSNEPMGDIDAVESAFDGLNASQLDVDLRTQEVIAYDGANFKLVGWNDFEDNYNADVPSGYQHILKLGSSNLVVMTDTGVQLLDPYANETHGTLAMTATFDRNSVAFIYHNNFVDPTDFTNDGDLYPHDVGLLSAEDGSVVAVDYDYTREVFTLAGWSLAASSGYTTGFAGIGLDADGDTAHIQVLLKSGTQDGIKLRVSKLVDDTGTLLTAAATTEFVAGGAALWGSETTGISIIQGFIDYTDDTIVLFTHTPTRDVVSKITFAGAVVWTSLSPFEFPATVSTGERKSPVPSADYLWIDGDNIVSLNLATGAIALKTTLSAQGWPAINGAQYFDGRTRTLTYVKTDNALARVFLDKVTAQDISLADVFSGMAVKSNLPYNTVDVSDLSAITIKGYMLEDNDTIASVAQVLGKFYQFALVDDGTRIYFERESQVGSVVATVEDGEWLGDNLQIHHELLVTNNLQASVKFITIDDTGLVDAIQTASLRPDDSTVINEDNSDQYTFTLNDDPLHMRTYLEKVLSNQQMQTKTLEVELSPKFLALTPVDRIIVNGDTYRLSSHEINDDNRLRLQGTLWSQSIVDEDVAISTVQTVTATQITRVGKADPYRPVILFTNALTEQDSQRSLDGNQIVYCGIEAPTDDIAATSISLQFPAQYGVGGSKQYTSPLIKQACKYGRLITPPQLGRMNIFTSDPTDTMVVKFQRASALAKFQNFDRPVDVLEQPLANLLVLNREYIQFGNYSVDVDGLTVTFTNLFRGIKGTEFYASQHAVNDRVYVFDQDSFVAMSVATEFTSLANFAHMYVQKATPAGVQMIDFGVRSDAGAARPLPPTDIYAKALDDNDAQQGVSFKTRRPVFVSFENGGEQPNDWLTNSFAIITSAVRLTPEDFDNNYVRFTPVQPNIFPVTIPPGRVSRDAYVFVDMAAPGAQPVWVYVVQLVYNSAGVLYAGHPGEALFTPANLLTLPRENDPYSQNP